MTEPTAPLIQLLRTWISSRVDAAPLAWIDDRADYGELRIVALAPIGDRLFFVVFVDRDEGRRIISLRRANRREVNHYVRANEESLHPGSDS